MAYWYLAFAIVAEVIGTVALKLTDGFSKPLPVIVVIIGYGISFYLLSLVVKTIPLGVTYAIWSSVGIVLLGIIGIFLFDEIPDFAAMLGMALIVLGVIMINLFSKTLGH